MDLQLLRVAVAQWRNCIGCRRVATAAAAAAAWRRISACRVSWTQSHSAGQSRERSVGAAMSEAGSDGDGAAQQQQDNAALLLWSLGAWHRQQQRHRDWLASNRRRQHQLRAINKVLTTRSATLTVYANLPVVVTVCVKCAHWNELKRTQLMT